MRKEMGTVVELPARSKTNIFMSFRAAAPASEVYASSAVTAAGVLEGVWKSCMNSAC